MNDPAARPANPTFPPLEMPTDLEPVYANLVRISHSPTDLVLDFARLLPGDRSARISTRVLMSPIAAKMFSRALAENLARYEATFGEIVLPGGMELANDLFRGTRPPEPPGEPPGSRQPEG